MGNKDNKDKEYEWILKHFQQMELRYHTWMNYYSLFNGALLVAYCTLLVSVGKVIEKTPYVMGEMCNNDGVELFSLNCTYWEFLTLIAGLGLFASVCWLLSMRGHVAWLDSWRWALRSKGYEFDHTIYVGKKKDGDSDVKENTSNTNDEKASNTNDKKVIDKLPLYSTAKITICFIWAIIVAWFLAMVYSHFKGDLSNYADCIGCSLLWIIIVAVLFLVIRTFVPGGKRYSLKSDISDFKLEGVFQKAPSQSSGLRLKIIHAIGLVVSRR